MARAEAEDLLAEYKAKRDFGKTPEPGRSARKAKATASSSRSTRRAAPISISGSSMTAC